MLIIRVNNIDYTFKDRNKLICLPPETTVTIIDEAGKELETIMIKDLFDYEDYQINKIMAQVDVSEAEETCQNYESYKAMKSKTSNKWYYCRYCNSRFRSKFVAENCFNLDMALLEKPERKLIPLKEYHKKLKK